MATGDRKLLTRDDWLAAALEALLEGGLEAVRVLPLSKRLGVSRGSFYWHFADREELLHSILEYWERVFTDVVIEELASAPGAPRRRIWRFMSLVVEQQLSRYDPAIRAWALYDKEAARAVRRVDGKRLAIVESLFRDAGFSPQQATARSRLLAVYLIGDDLVLVHEEPEARKKLLRLRYRMLVAEP
ncbi:MAG: TetR/AcrR family transcriptional regulator [Myxococcales bacterium]|jgi:AcrR family transcriptional regulator|nr:TetR/AcrR family transcriptional regulator [Myxococcales bacterium]